MEVFANMVVEDSIVVDRVAVAFAGKADKGKTVAGKAVVAFVGTADMDNRHCNLEEDIADDFDGDDYVNVGHSCNLDTYNSCYSGTDSCCYSLDMDNCCNFLFLYNIRDSIKILIRKSSGCDSSSAITSIAISNKNTLINLCFGKNTFDCTRLLFICENCITKF